MIAGDSMHDALSCTEVGENMSYNAFVVNMNIRWERAGSDSLAKL